MLNSNPFPQSFASSKNSNIVDIVPPSTKKSNQNPVQETFASTTIQQSELNSQPQKTPLEIAELLISLGLSPLPVAPKTKKTNGKQPSFLTAKSEPTLIEHSKYHDNQPDMKVVSRWLKNPQTGIGSLGSKEFYWIDIDCKHFDSQQACDALFYDFLDKYPRLKTTWLERTRSGGYRILIKLLAKPDFTNFSFGDGDHAGELLGYGRFAVLAPTDGYTNINYPDDVPIFDCIEALGLSRYGSQKQATKESISEAKEVEKIQEKQLANLNDYRASLNLKDSDLFLGDCITKKHQEYLSKPLANNAQIDRSQSLTALYKDLVGWENWLKQNIPNLTIQGDIDYLMSLAANNLQIVPDRLERIIASMTSRDKFNPSLYEVTENKGSDGDKACLLHINRILKIYDPWLVTNQLTIHQAVFNTTFDRGNAGYFTQNNTCFKYTGNGFSSKIEDALMRKFLSEDLAMYYELKQTKNGFEEIRKFSNYKNIKECLSYCYDRLAISRNIDNRHLICLNNGTLNVRTNELQPHEYEDYLTWAINADYTPNSGLTEHIEHFFTRQYGAEFLKLIQAMIRYYIDPSMPPGKFFHFLGDSGTGKGLMIRLLASLFDPSCVKTLSDLDILNTDEKKYQYLVGTYFAYLPDVIKYAKEPEAFYEAIDQGSFSVRKLHSSDVSFVKCLAKFAMASVKQIQTAAASTGWARRAVTIPTTDQKINGLFSDESLQSPENKSAIISWALSISREEAWDVICKSTEENAKLKAVKEEQELYNNVVRSFFDATIQPTKDSNAYLTPDQIHQAYFQWAKASGFVPLNKNNFKELLRIDDVLRQYLVKRCVVRRDGKNTAIPNHYKNLEFIKDAFTNPLETGDLRCVPSNCVEGNWELIKNFWQISTTTNEEVTEVVQSNAPDTLATQQPVATFSLDDHDDEDLILASEQPTIEQPTTVEQAAEIDFEDVDALKLELLALVGDEEGCQNLTEKISERSSIATKKVLAILLQAYGLNIDFG